MPFDEVDPHCIGCTSCAYVCPTGAIEIVDDLNRPVDPQLIRDHGMKINAEMATLDKSQCCMREVGTANIVEVMDKYDLLPVHNYRFGSHPRRTEHRHAGPASRTTSRRARPTAAGTAARWPAPRRSTTSCSRPAPTRGSGSASTAPSTRPPPAAPTWAASTPTSASSSTSTATPTASTRSPMATCIAFVMESFEAGVIDETHTGGLKLNFGAGGRGARTPAPDGARRGLRRRRRPGHPLAQAEVGGASTGPIRRSCRTSAWRSKGLEYLRVRLQGVARPAGRLHPGRQGAAARRGLAHLHGHGQQPDPDLRGQGRGALLLPALAHLVRPAWASARSSGTTSSRPTTRRCRRKQAAKIPEHVENYFKFFEGMTGMPARRGEDARPVGARVQPAALPLAYMLGKGHARGRHAAVPRRRPGHEGGVRVARRALRQAAEGDSSASIRRASTVEEKMAILRKYREEQYRQGDRRRVPAPRLDAERRADDRRG